MAQGTGHMAFGLSAPGSLLLVETVLSSQFSVLSSAFHPVVAAWHDTPTSANPV